MALSPPARRRAGSTAALRRQSCPGLVWFGLVWFGDFSPPQPSELPSSRKTGLVFCILDFMLLCLQQGGVAE